MTQQTNDIVALIKTVTDDFLIVTDDADNLMYVWRNKHKPLMRGPWRYSPYQFNAVFINLANGTYQGRSTGLKIEALNIGFDRFLTAFSGNQFDPSKARPVLLTGSKAKAMKKEADALLNDLHADWIDKLHSRKAS